MKIKKNIHPWVVKVTILSSLSDGEQMEELTKLFLALVPHISPPEKDRQIADKENNLKKMLTNIQTKNPYCSFIFLTK